MNFTIKDHLIYLDDKQVKYIQAPDYSDTNINPLYLIEHFTGDINKGQAVSWLTKKDDTPVSAHIIIEMDGTVTQTVKLNKKAYHAGESEWNGIKGLNSFSVGIELVNPGRLTKKNDKYYFGTKEIDAKNVVYLKHKNESTSSYWYTYNEDQLKVAEALSKAIVDHYDMKDILGHDDIAPKRKSDPGPAFPMERFKKLITKSISKNTTTNVNLRTGGSTSDKIITVIPANSKVQVLTEVNGWSRINFNGTLGFVSSTYLK